jgi:nucleotide-binding universal stress UspA family protein
MSTRGTPFVLVGVDGSPGDTQTVRYAVREARRTGASVRLAHVSPAWIPMAPSTLGEPPGLQSLGHSILYDAAGAARLESPDCTITERLLSGPRDSSLLRAAEGAQLIVLGHAHRSLVARIFTGTLNSEVSARAGCPVVSVCSEWDPDRIRGRVLVGVKSATHAAELLDLAFATAAARGAQLVVLHAWKLPDAYDDLIESRVATSDWADEAASVIDPLLEQARADHPGVRARLEVVHAQPARALVDASRAADVLLMVRRSPRHPAGRQLRGTARAVIREAHCPVEVVAPDVTGPTVADLSVERAGAMQR